MTIDKDTFNRMIENQNKIIEQEKKDRVKKDQESRLAANRLKWVKLAIAAGMDPKDASTASLSSLMNYHYTFNPAPITDDEHIDGDYYDEDTI
jgi:hypothetical protein